MSQMSVSVEPVGGIAIGRRGIFWLSAVLVIGCYLIASGNVASSTVWAGGFSKAERLEHVSKIAEGRAARQIGFVVLGLGSGLLWLFTRPRLRIDLGAAGLLLAMAAWSLVSVAWSIDPPLTAKRLVVLGCFLVALMQCAANLSLRQIAQMMILAGAVYLVGGLAAEWFFGPGGRRLAGWRFAGLNHPNQTAMIAFLATMGAVYLFDRTRRRSYAIFAVAGLMMLAMTKSRSALMALMIALAVYGLLRLPARARAFVALMAGALIAAAMVAHAVSLDEVIWKLMLMGRTDSDPRTLTGRTELWAVLWHEVTNDPGRFIAGHGYKGFWNPEMAAYVSGRLGWTFGEGHNLFVDLLLDLGAVGLVTAIGLYLASLVCWVRSFVAGGGASAALGISILAAIPIHGFTESMLLEPHLPTFLILLLMAIAAVRSPLILAGEGRRRAIRRRHLRALRLDRDAQAQRAIRER